MIDRKKVLDFGQEIIDFLTDCGGPYSDGVGNFTVYSIFYCLGSLQYVIKKDESGIKWFACYWKIDKTDIESVKERMRPADISYGDTVYVVACGCKDKDGLKEIRRAIREKSKGCQGVFWHRPVKEDKVFYFPKQKGA